MNKQEMRTAILLFLPPPCLLQVRERGGGERRNMAGSLVPTEKPPRPHPFPRKQHSLSPIRQAGWVGGRHRRVAACRHGIPRVARRAATLLPGFELCGAVAGQHGVEVVVKHDAPEVDKLVERLDKDGSSHCDVLFFGGRPTGSGVAS